MAVQERTYQDPTAGAIRTLLDLGGNKEKQTASTTGDPRGTAGLQTILDQQLRGITPEGAAELIRAIFTQGMEQVPGLATTYGQAAGARTSNNSQFQLALQDMMAKLTVEAAKQLRGNQDSASATAGRLAESSRTQTQTAQKNPKASAMQLLPFALANAGKLKKFGTDIFKTGQDLFGNSSTPLSDAGVNFGSSSYSPAGADNYSLFYDQGPSMAMDFGASEPVSDLFSSGFTDFGGMDAVSAAYDWGGGFDTSLIDAGGDFLGFANGGYVTRKPKGYAEGGVVRRARKGGDLQSTDRTSNIRDTQGNELRGITYNESGNAIFDLLRAIDGEARALGQGRMPGRRQRPQMPTVEPSGETGSSGVGEGIAEGTVGTGITAEGLGTVASIAGMATGIPGIAVSMGLNALGFPTVSPMMAFINAITDVPVTPPNPFAVDGGSAGGTSSVSAEGVAEATGIAGANAGGLGGMGVTMGLDDAFAPDGGIGGTVGGGSSTGGTDGVGDAASAGVGGGGFARGGEVDGPKGRDVIPAYLTDGEYVIKNRVVERLGIPFFDAINSMFDGEEEAQRGSNMRQAAPAYKGR